MTLKTSVKDPIARFVFAHGAGAGMESDFMQSVAEGLAIQSIEVVRFDFEYMQKAKALSKKRPPDKFEKLQVYFQQVLADLANEMPLFIGGKSMGGRVASTILDNSPAIAAVVFGYPFHPPGKPEKLRTEHLQALTKPMLVLQGERDTFGKQAEVESYTLSESVQLQFLPDGDHSFKPRKSSGKTLQENVEVAVKLAASFIQEQI